MKKIIFIALLCWAGTTLSAQSSEEIQKERTGYEQPYHPEEDGYMRINQLLQQAKKKTRKYSYKLVVTGVCGACDSIT